ncbi:DUF2599 domain-containing protein [Isoptericola sp. F-RaC21]|uniref:DUF2599 domain-containing protein n=1 Tax=Isoptericola sp. F-RaC21 TaxID=3141452 RepID=UPI00315B8156
MPPRPRSRVVPTLALLLTLGACTPAAPAPTEGPPDTPSPTTPTTGAPPVRAELAAGDVTLEVTAPPPPGDDPPLDVSTDAGADTATLTVDAAALADAGDGPGAAVARLALTSAGTLEPHPDGSVTVRDDDGPVGGLSAPRGARLVAVDATHLELRPTSATAEHDEVTTVLGTAAVAGTDWGDREGGRSLAVVPTDWAREAGQAGTDLVWAELVAADPGVDSATMHDQLECHAIGAPDKDSWNLEPWRPDVGLVATMAARCNPTP